MTSRRFRVQPGPGGFTLAEILLALGLVTVALLALIGHSTLLVGATQKGDDTNVASSVARAHLDRLAREVVLDQPPGRRDVVWDYSSAEAPFLSTTERVGFTDYQVELYVTDVINTTTGHPLGSGPTGTENPKTRLKQIQVTVRWWDNPEGQRAGYGRLELQAARLLKVTRVDS
jgi:hypothetical protein